MKKAVIYIHGKGGSAAEAEHYTPLFPDSTVIGFDYRAQTPWEAAQEFVTHFDSDAAGYDEVCIIANSIGAYFSLCALGAKNISKAYFISPIVNMEQLICDMMVWANVNEAELEEKKEIPTAFGETLSWEYLLWVRSHPIKWNILTEILYGEKDNQQSLETIRTFAEEHDANVTVMDDGEHWFHTAEQMAFLDDWIRKVK